MSTDYQSKIIHQHLVATDTRNTGLCDNRKRCIGMKIELFEFRFAPFTPDEKRESRVFYNIEPGFYYSVRCQTTRDGKLFGPIQSTRHFKTCTERDKFIANRWASMVKRCQRQ